MTQEDKRQLKFLWLGVVWAGLMCIFPKIFIPIAVISGLVIIAMVFAEAGKCLGEFIGGLTCISKKK